MLTRLIGDAHRARRAPLCAPACVVCVVGCALIAGIACAPQRARAQGGTPEVKVLLAEIADIDEMHAVGPLKLQPDQAGRLADAIESDRVSYNKAVAEMGSPPLLKLADEIHAQRQKAIHGEPVAQEFLDKVKAIENDFAARRKVFNDQSIRSLISTAKRTLTSDQLARAEALERPLVQKAEAPAGPDDCLKAYVVDIFVDGSRIVAVLRAISAGPAAGTNAPAAPDATHGAPDQVASPQITQLLQELADIEELQAMAPLKLTPDQAGQLADAVEQTRAAYLKNVDALGSPPLLKMADEIHAERRSALSGIAIPGDFDDKVKDIEAGFLRRRDALNAQNILGLTAAAQRILSAAQITEAESLEEQILTKAKKHTGTADQRLHAYVLAVLINDPRAVEALRAMKTGA